METSQRFRLGGIVLPLAILLGLSTAAFDLAAPFGDDTAKATIVLLLATGGLLGFLQPRLPWRWGLAIGVWMPLAHVFFHVLGWDHAINPNTISAHLLLLAVSVAIATAGSYLGAIFRKVFGRAETSR